ncbi:hypothetical protein WJX72_008597 [[Myrmecia] bisecta]|uniref:Uncharacterized protein n=1 Tax=[Myrmecia] bisecta TaxID=41462 RepID=A0AAW1PTJ8_9CHLO
MEALESVSTANPGRAPVLALPYVPHTISIATPELLHHGLGLGCDLLALRQGPGAVTFGCCVLLLQTLLTSVPRVGSRKGFDSGPSTRFHDDRSDKWFVPFDADTPATHAAARRSTISRLLATGHTPADVQKVAEIVRADGDLQQLADYMTPMVNSRFIDGQAIPNPVIDAARAPLNSIGDALRPGNYQKAHEGMRQLLDFCNKAVALPPDQLQAMDVAHNMSAVACKFTEAVQTLKASPTTPIDKLFTIPKNLPTPTIPRIAVAPTTFGDLLAYPAIPNKTVFLLSNSSAAGATGSLWYTFGSGTPDRACAFKPFFEAFMADLQKELVRQAAPAKKEE